MIQIDEQLCTGCGTCVNVCPKGAISLQGGVATLTVERCDNCGACADACTQGAILLVERVEPGSQMLMTRPTAQPSVPAATMPSGPLVTHQRTSFLPLMASFLRWAGTALAPHLADIALQVLDRRVTSSPLSRTQGLGTTIVGRMWRHRYRQRGPRS